MDASQITKLLQKQNTRYIHRPQTVDSSTLTWKKQIQSSTYIAPSRIIQPAGCASETGACSYGGQGKQTTLMTGSTQLFPNVLAGATGSGSEVYSSERILLQRAGKQSCGAEATGITSIELPECFCANTNAPTETTDAPVNNQSNPYLPPFDTYYRFKHPQCPNPQDKHQKHVVVVGHGGDCDGCVVTPTDVVPPS